MKKISYSYLVCFAVMLQMACSLGMSAAVLSVFIPYVRDSLGLSNAQASMIVTLRSVSAAVFLVFIDKYIKLLGLRKASFLGTLMLGLGFVVLKAADGYFLVCVAACLIGCSVSACGLVVGSLIIYRWFESGKDVALSVSSMGTGIVGIIMPPVSTYLIENISLDTALLFAGLVAMLFGLISYTIIRNSPEEMGILPYNNGRISLEKAYGEEYGGRINYCLYAVFLLVGLCSLATSTLSASLYRSIGFDPYLVSFAVSVLSISNPVSKLLYGIVTEKKGVRIGALSVTVCLAASALFNCLSGTGVSAFMIIAGVFSGIGITSATLGVASVARTFSSKEYFPRRLRNIQFFNSVGGSLSGIYVGTAAEITGSYVKAWYGILLLSLIAAALLIFAFAYKSARDKRV